MSGDGGKVGKYEILGEIGRGGMGSVFKARDPVLDRPVALKTMSVDVLAEEGMRERFLREARSAARLQHPNIVTVYEFGEVDGAPFIAMEYLEGENLADAAMLGRFPNLDAKLAVAAQLCDGLAFAHRNGVIHRDVKPSNVIVMGGDRIKIVDFGIAWLDDTAVATRTGMLLGTPSYMAPEQFTGEPIDHRVDQWAVGVILYELIIGKPPFDAGTVPALIYQIVHTPPPLLGRHGSRLSPRLVAVVEKALTKDRQRRFSDLEVMARALRQVREELPTVSRPAPALDDEGLDDTVVVSLEESFADGLVPGAGTMRPPAAARQPTAARGGFVEDGIFGEERRTQVILVTADDTRLVAGGTDGSIRVWDLETRMKIATFRNRVHMRTGHGSLTTALALSEDGARLASGHLDGAIYLWELDTGLELEARLTHDGAIAGLAFTPGDGTLISASADATIRFWEMEAVLAGDARRLLRRQPEAATCLALARMGRVVVTGHANRSLRAHDTMSYKLVATIHGHRAPVSALAVSPSGEVVASGGRDGAVRLHHIDTREARGTYFEHTRAVAGLTFFPDGRRVASVAMDNAVLVWDMGDPELPLALTGLVGEAFAGVRLTTDGRRLLGATADGHFRVWLVPD